MSRQRRPPRVERQEKRITYTVRALGHCPATGEAAPMTIVYTMLPATVTIEGYERLDPVTQRALIAAAQRTIDNTDQAFRAILSEQGAEREAVDAEATPVEPAPPTPVKAARLGPRVV